MPNAIFAPPSVLVGLGLIGNGEEVGITWRNEEAFPEATRIVLRPQDSAFYHADAKEELERALTRIGVLQAGQSIIVPLQVLGGFEICFDVIVTEPASIVLMQGDEVALEFEEALDGAAEAQAPAPPAPPAGLIRPGSPLPEEDFGVLEEPGILPAFPGGGQILGGSIPKPAVNGRPWNPYR